MFAFARTGHPSRAPQTQALALVLVGTLLFAASMVRAPLASAEQEGSETAAQPAAQEQTAPVEPTPTPEIQPTPTEPPPAAPALPPEEPTPTPVPSEPAPDPAPAQSEPAPADPQNSEASAGIDASEPGPTPPDEPTATPEPAPELGYNPADEPRCLPSAAPDGVISHGASLDYDCTYDVQLAGAHAAPSDVQLDWEVRATVAGGWSVQLLPPSSDPNVPPEWTNSDRTEARFDYREPAAPAATTDAPESFEETRTLRFGLRVHRAACDETAQPVRLGIAAIPSLPGLDAAIQMLGEQPNPDFALRPELAPIPEPTMTFGGSLDFGEIAATSEGPIEQPAPQELTVTVKGLDQACGTYDLRLASSSFDGSDGTELTASTLELVSINGEDVPDVCPLGDGCSIASLPTGASAAPTTTYTLGVSLVIPDRARVAVFTSTLTASLDRTDPAPP